MIDMKSKINTNIYLASGWFTSVTADVLSRLEDILKGIPNLTVYSPRRDGVKLTPNQRHETSLREQVFYDNLAHIRQSDYIIANITGDDDYDDPGTVYEIGYAMAQHIKVIGVTTNIEKSKERYRSLWSGFYKVLNINEEDNLKTSILGGSKKVLLAGSGIGNTDSEIVRIYMDHDIPIRWLNTPADTGLYECIDQVFEDIDYVLAVIDDRKTIPSWVIGQAYARHIPVVTYSNFQYGINVMLLVSVCTHIRGTEELEGFIEFVAAFGITEVPAFDISQLDAI